VPEIAAAAARSGVDAVLLTDHDTLAARRRGEERWFGDVLVCVGEEVSPSNGNHYLAFGVHEEVDRRLPPAEIIAAVHDQGGIGFLAHPFSQGSERFSRSGIPWQDLEAGPYTGIELWSWVTDTAERFRSLADVARFVAAPQRLVDHPPGRNLAEWDRLAARRPVVALGGIDAHQVGRRIGGRVPVRLMSYARSFGHMRTHVLLDEPVTGDVEADVASIYAALGAGRCYLAIDSLAPSRGFDFHAADVKMGAQAPLGDGHELVARVPRPAALALVHDGRLVVGAHGTELRHRAAEKGVWRLEARLQAHGRERTWILSNPVYLR
jgi:hypothetical protein